MKSAIGDSDLLIVGPGVLGALAGQLWKQRHPGATVVGQTVTENNHPVLRSLGLEPRTRSQAGSERYPFVLYSAPASGAENPLEDIKAALQLWDGRGSFVYTASGGVYVEDNGGDVDETSPVVARGAGERSDRLLDLEDAVFSASGNVVRYVGLYHCNRGAHTFFLRQGTVARPGSYLVNLLHYEDAASMAVAALAGDGSGGKGYRGKLFLGADGVPVTFRDMMDATLRSGKFQGQVTFTEADEPQRGKRVSNRATREQLGWAPKYASFASFMDAGGDDAYNRDPEGLGSLGLRHGQAPVKSHKEAAAKN